MRKNEFGCPIGHTGRKEVMFLKGMMKAIIWDLNFNQLRIVLLAIIAWTQTGVPLTIRDIEEIVDEARAQ